LSDAAAAGRARRAHLAALGRDITPVMVAATVGVYLPLLAAEAPDVELVADLRYGGHDRHRLDLYRPAARDGGGAPRPVFVFVHGGGFVAGDKAMPGIPFYANIGRWAVRNGWLGVALTYRLAPAFRWPSGSDDVGAALRWLRANVAAHGGDPERIVVMGQSAGATHVAGCLAREFPAGDGGQAPGDGWRPAAAILLSGLYDPPTMERSPLFSSYFGDESQARAADGLLAGLAGTAVPFLATVASLDPPMFQDQFTRLLAAFLARHGRLPDFLPGPDDNHISPAMQIGSSADVLGPKLVDWLAGILRPG
jgi:acetyl esterase/lipase